MINRLVLLALLATPAFATFTLVVQTSKTLGATGGSTTPINTATAKSLHVHLSREFDGAVLTDSTSLCASPCNTWTARPQYGTGRGTQWFDCLSGCTVGTGHTFTTTAQYTVVEVYAFTAAGVITFDQQAGIASTTNPLSPGTITPTIANELFITGIQGQTSFTTATNVGGFTGNITCEAGSGATPNYGGCSSYLISVGSAAQTSNWTAAVTGGTPIAVDVIAYKEVTSSTITASPSFVVVSSTGNVITITGTGTAWTPGTPGTPTFTVSGGTAPSITAQTVASTTSATITLSAGSATGILTITDPSTTSTTTINVINSITNANWVFSPYSWYSNGGGAMGANNIKGSSTFAQCDNAGCYFKTIFSGVSATLNYSTPQTVGTPGTPDSYTILHWSIDNGPTQTHTLISGETSTILGIALANTTHTLFCYVAHLSYNQDRWTTPTASIKITGLTLAAGGALTAPSGAIALRAKNALFFGDSITEGFYDTGGVNDADFNYVHPVAESLGAEFGQIGFSATGWVKPYAPNNNPNFSNSWNFYFGTNSRLVAGKLSPIPDYVVINQGTNDSAGIQATVTSTITAIRAAVNVNTPILVLIPFRQTLATEIAAGITGTADAYVFKIDCGVAMSYGVLGAGSATRIAGDGLHPNQLGHELFGAAVANRIATALAPAGTGGVKAVVSFQ